MFAMVNRLFDLLRRFPFVDLVIHALYELRSYADCVWSTFVCRAKASLMGVEIGPRARVWGKVIFHRFPGTRIHIGANVRIVSRPYRYAQNIFPQSKLRTMSPTARIEIGDNVGFNSISIMARSQLVQIGSGTMIGGNCQISDSDGHPLWPPESRAHYPGSEFDAPVKIGANVFIGINVIVLKGVEIGDNSVIGAGSVVTSPIPPNCVAGGVPAKVVRELSDAGVGQERTL